MAFTIKIVFWHKKKIIKKKKKLKFNTQYICTFLKLNSIIFKCKVQKNVFCCYLKFTNRAYHGKINTATCDGLQYCTNFYQNVEWLNRQWHIIQIICRVIFTLHLNIILFNFKNKHFYWIYKKLYCVQMYCVFNLSFFFFNFAVLILPW
jgi:hypothetical protein